MPNYLFVALLSVLFSSEGCRRQQRLQTTDSVPSSSTDSTTNTGLNTNPVTGAELTDAHASVAETDFIYLTAKSKIAFKSQADELDNASLTIRMQKDSLIWLSISKLGIEAIRGIITPDSVKIIDKLHRDYIAYSFPALSRQFNFTMSFGLLQALLVGNLPFGQLPAKKTDNEPGFILRQQDSNVLIENYVNAANRKLTKLTLTQQPGPNTLRADYENFESVQTFLLPFTALLTLDYQSPGNGQMQQTALRIKHNKVELTNQSPGFPFTVPASYARRP